MTAGPFFEQFIDDYFAECDEHLTVVRRALLALEQRGTFADDPSQRHALSRSLHTLKGLSGMVGLSSAERVAHALEEVLRALGDEVPDPRLVEALFDGVRLLERCVGARRSGGEPPDVEEYLARAGAFGAARSPTQSPPESATPAADELFPLAAEQARDEEARADAYALIPHVASEDAADESVVYRFCFAPSRELAERGIGVETVRERLQALGTLLAARPHVVPGGGVVFEFVVAVPPGVTPDERWRADRVTWAAAAAPRTPGVQLAAAQPDGTLATALPRSPNGGAPRSPPAHLADAPAASLLGLASTNSVRVDLTRLDDIMRMVGELVISRARLDDLLGREDQPTVAAVGEALQETNAALERQLRALREGVMRIRLVPIGEVFERMRFAVRDIARESAKLVTFELSGQATEIDKLVVDRMLEPLLHLVRNAVSHGIESPTERLAAGKPAEGRLALRAAAAGDRIVIEVEDDGQGIDAEQVAARARDQGLPVADGELDGEALLDVLCAPGFSTREEANLASGRGVGMEVVRAGIRALGGELALETERGRGTRFTAELPLTLMIVDALLVDIGSHQMAVPQPVLREILRLDASSLTRFEANAVIPYRGGVLPLLSLRDMFGVPRTEQDPLYVLVVGSDAHPTGLVVDRVVGLREIVVHSVTDPLVAVPGIAGATELGDGRVCLIIDAAALVHHTHERRDLRLAAARAGVRPSARATMATPALAAGPEERRTRGTLAKGRPNGGIDDR